MPSKYNDLTATIQVIGNVFNNPSLLENTDKYSLTDQDFPNEFHRIVFGCIYKLYELGSSQISLENIEDFLSARPKSQGVFKAQKGEEWLLKASDAAMLSAFDYYYNRLKKMSLLRAYDNIGVDVSDIYDPDNILDMKRKQLQEEQLDNSSLMDIVNKIDIKIERIKSDYIGNEIGESYQAGEGIKSLVERLREYPEVGVPLYGPLVNTVTRGARLKKFYLRSAPTGIGKTRSMIADACFIGCNELYDEKFGWINNGTAEPVLYITTEQELEEIQTMMMAFLACVNEEHILNGKYTDDEYERVMKATDIIENSPIYIEVLPDFSLQDVENKIKKHIREHDVKYVFHDYIHTSLKILEEITRRSGGVRLREDNVLFMMSIKLKDLCNKYGVFILSATQLNGQYQDADTPDQNLLRGAKAIADKIDVGEILLPVKPDDLESLQPILSSNAFGIPTIKLSVYKNRRGRYKSIFLWCESDLGSCRIKPMFATTYDYELININDIKIITEEKESAF